MEPGLLCWTLLILPIGAPLPLRSKGTLYGTSVKFLQNKTWSVQKCHNVAYDIAVLKVWQWSKLAAGKLLQFSRLLNLS